MSPDVVALNPGGNTVTVLLNNGNGTFQTAKSYDSGLTCGSIAIGDVDGDDHLDVAVACNKIWFLIGDGKGGLALSNNLITNYYPGSIALKDLNSDGMLDLVASRPQSEIGVFFGNGDQTFSAETVYKDGGYFVLADLDNDGDQDLGTATGIRIAILLNDGGGIFVFAGYYTINKSPYGIAAADFNGDENLDLITTNFYGFGVSVLMGRGNGKFDAQIAFETGDPSEGIAVGDVDGDSLPDVLTSIPYEKKVTVTLNDGNWRSTQGNPMPGRLIREAATTLIEREPLSDTVGLNSIATNDSGFGLEIAEAAPFKKSVMVHPIARRPAHVSGLEFELLVIDTPFLPVNP